MNASSSMAPSAHQPALFLIHDGIEDDSKTTDSLGIVDFVVPVPSSIIAEPISMSTISTGETSPPTTENLVTPASSLGYNYTEQQKGIQKGLIKFNNKETGCFNIMFLDCKISANKISTILSIWVVSSAGRASDF